MRIGIVSEYCRPWPGGIPEHVHHEAAELRTLGHDVVVITGGGGDEGDDRHGDDGVVRLGKAFVFTSNGARSRLALGSFLWSMRQRLEALRLDVLHVHAPLDPCLPLTAALCAPCPVVGTFHASFARTPLFDAIYAKNPLARRAFERLRGRIAVSKEARRSIEQYFPGDYSVISNGVDLRRFKSGAPPTNAVPRVLFVGRSDPRKGLALLMSACASLERRGCALELVLAGVRGEEIAVPGRARALGYVAPEDMPQVYASADVFCSPATTGESQGVVWLEAMASGRPCVGFDIPGYREVIQDERTGLLVRERTAEALAAAIERLLRDAPLRGRLGAAGRVEIERYAWPRVAERIEAELRQACEQR